MNSAATLKLHRRLSSSSVLPELDSWHDLGAPLPDDALDYIRRPLRER